VRPEGKKELMGSPGSYALSRPLLLFRPNAMPFAAGVGAPCPTSASVRSVLIAVRGSRTGDVCRVVGAMVIGNWVKGYFRCDRQGRRRPSFLAQSRSSTPLKR
jgi:hypothetical protein